ncbi:hypothetical protein QN277_020942 [Acacia crassicarpa]|uniref:Uncharacterized protein n=1 Tax=Acacia crassicarpa TaxID=499986 RepID=A0AAE1KFM3_9FABA|nr:hypothetical protein QN277_020942 [Acacia crassicarpa]
MDPNLLAQLQSTCEILRSECPKIQRVAHHLRNRNDFSKYYSPRMLSLGPIHHGEPHLKVGEKYKIMWASMYVQRDQEGRAQSLFRNIAENIEDLKNLYDEDTIGQFNDQQLAQMLFLDGCALLQILKHPDILKSEPLKAKVDQMALVRQDALLLENQLPFRVLHLLSDQPEYRLIEDMKTFLRCHHFSPADQKLKQKNGAKEDDSRHLSTEVPPQNVAQKGDSHQHHSLDIVVPNPAHLLDQLRRVVLAEFHPPGNKPATQESGTITHRNLKELNAAGIQVKRSKSNSPIDISFSSCCLTGELKLPNLVVDDTSASTYLNLMAYEACPDFENEYEISSYIEFLDSLVDHPDDVKELRKAKVLINRLGSDEELAKLFNIIGKDVVPNDAIYAYLRDNIESHYQIKYKAWYALAMATYCSNPWSITALMAASLLLILTFVQAWFAAFPSHP